MVEVLQPKITSHRIPEHFFRNSTLFFVLRTYVKNKLSNFQGKELVKVFSYTGISMLVKLITNYIMVKVVSAIIGPPGMALVGQLQNFIAIFTTAGSAGINNGVVKYIAENKEDGEALKPIISSGFLITVAASAFFGIVSMIFAGFWSGLILKTPDFTHLFVLFGISLILLSVNNFFLSVVNGFTEYQIYVRVQIISSIAGLIVTVILAFLYQLQGVLIALISYQGAMLGVSYLMLRRKKWLNRSIWNQFSKQTAYRFTPFLAMALVTAVTVPVSQLVVRGFIIDQFSLNTAGLWEAINKISAMYLMFITASFSVYYLPKISQTRERSELKSEIFKTYQFMLPLTVVSLFLIFILKDFVIQLLFTTEFSAMKPLFLYQLLGDFFKVMSWLLAFVMVAKSMTKTYIITEVVFALFLIVLSRFLIESNGAVGATQAYCVTYFVYSLVMVFVFRNLIFGKK